MLCGNSNAHNALQGNNYTDGKEKEIERVVESRWEATDLVLFNNGSGNRINHSGTLSALDLTFLFLLILPQNISGMHTIIHLLVTTCLFYFSVSSPIHTDWPLYPPLCSLLITEDITSDDLNELTSSLVSFFVDPAYPPSLLLNVNRSLASLCEQRMS